MHNPVGGRGVGVRAGERLVGNKLCENDKIEEWPFYLLLMRGCTLDKFLCEGKRGV
jgi:hypothetical protein